MIQVCKAFGGYSLDPPSDGAWLANDGRVYKEPSRKLEVIVSEEVHATAGLSADALPQHQVTIRGRSEPMMVRSVGSASTLAALVDDVDVVAA